MIRVADYIAGLLAAWNLKTNQLPAKYTVLTEDFAADSKNTVVFKIQMDENGAQCSRIVARSKPISLLFLRLGRFIGQIWYKLRKRVGNFEPREDHDRGVIAYGSRAGNVTNGNGVLVRHHYMERRRGPRTQTDRALGRCLAILR